MMSLTAAMAVEPTAYAAPTVEMGPGMAPPEPSRGVVTVEEDGGLLPERCVSRFRRICVYCGNAKGRKASYQDAAVELGKEMAAVRRPEG